MNIAVGTGLQGTLRLRRALIAALLLSLISAALVGCRDDGHVASVPDGRLVTKDAGAILWKLGDANDPGAQVDKASEFPDRGELTTPQSSEASITARDANGPHPWFAWATVYVYRKVATAQSEYAKQAAQTPGVPFPAVGHESVLAVQTVKSTPTSREELGVVHTKMIADLIFRESNVLVVCHAEGDTKANSSDRAQQMARVMASRIP